MQENGGGSKVLSGGLSFTKQLKINISEKELQDDKILVPVNSIVNFLF